MKQISTKKQDVMFVAVALVLLACVIVYVTLSVSFLAKKVEAALFEGVPQGPLITHFNFDKIPTLLNKAN